MRRFWPAGIALVAGLVLGVLTSMEARRPGLAAFGAFAYVGIAILIVATFAVITVAAVFMSRRPLAENAFLSGVALVTGAVVAGAAFTVAVPRPKQPVYLYATAHGGLDINVETFEPAGELTATCTSRPDSSALQQITIRDLGQLNGATLRAFMTVPEAGATTEIGLFVDVGEPEVTLAWRGNADLDLASGGVTGTASFAALPLEQLTPNAAPAGEWPKSLTGVLLWTCDPWLPPGSYLD